jgi:L-lactate dehydrogenase complex protein LldG
MDRDARPAGDAERELPRVVGEEARMTTARDVILQRIRECGTGSAEEARATYGQIERQYRQSAQLSQAQILDLLEERLCDYDARVYRIAEHEIAAQAAQLLAERNVHRVVVPQGLPSEWLRCAEFVEDNHFDAAALDTFDGVMTASAFAIAETGTIVLQSVAAQGRRAITLVPDYHLCVVRESDVVETVVEGMQWLNATSHLPTTFFSGPSATADIEMTRIKGVHGPRFVDVLLVHE